MHKNLKKVISAVAALALSASSFVALAATKFPDVAETANYAQAVDELTSLDIVAGYEDGTFQPDKLVSRAEITKMIVAALGAGDLQAAEAAAGQNTQFTDVTGSHWAAGFVTQGVSNGFIAGMGDGTFAPDANVTFAQAVKMLVCAVGYQTWAENVGGWPQGYMSYGSQLDITKGVSLNNDTELNRGQVAILIDNALNAPLLVRDGYTNDAWGRPQPNLVQKNGEGEDYQTLLTKNHDAYKVNGRVIETQMSSGAVDADEVKFRVEKADNFDDEYVKRADESSWQEVVAKYGETNAPDYLFTYAEALIQEVDDDEWEIISITASGKNDIVSFSSDYFDAENKNYDEALDAITGASPKMYVYTSDAKNKTTSYKISEDAEFFVNGREFDLANEANFNKYVVNNEVGMITLIDTPQGTSSSTDGEYDYVMVTYYVDAIVDEVSESAKSPKIYFENASESISSLTVDLEDDSINYMFKLGLDGEEIAVTDIVEDDILSIAYDVNTTFQNSDFYTVIVSRDTVEGKITSQNVDDGYLIGGNYYESASADLVANPGTAKALENGTEYTLYLDAFGKIAKADEGTSNKLYAVAERAYVDNSTGNNFLTIIDRTGSKHAYQLADQTAYADIAAYIADAGAQNPQDRVIEYSINSSNEIKIKAKVEPEESAINEEYTAKTTKIGGIKLGDNSVIINLVDYLDGDEPSIMGSLTDENEYTAYGYGKSSSDKTYKFVLITEGENGINIDSPIAVFSSVGTQDVDGDEYTAATIYSEGERKVILTDDADAENALNAMTEGTPFFYSVDGEGYVNEIELIFATALNNAIGDYDTFRSTAINLGDAYSFNAAIADGCSYKPTITNGKYVANLTSNSKDGLVKFGPIADKDSNSITLATYNLSTAAELQAEATEHKTDIGRLTEDSYDSTVSVTVYDYATHTSGRKLSVGSKASAIKSSYDKLAWIGDDKEKVDWDADGDMQLYTNFALIKTVDKDITDMYVILADQD